MRKHGWMLALAASLWSSTVAAESDDTLCFDVTIRGGLEPVCAEVYENEQSVPLGVTVLTVHGLSETAASWEPLAEALFEDPLYKNLIRRVVALDLPGRGVTPATPGFYADGASVFGTLLIHDNVNIIIQSISALHALDVKPRVIMGHSLGGLEIQGTQEALLAQGSSLAKLGIYRAILLAPVPNANATWTRSPTGDLSAFFFGVPGLPPPSGQPPFEYGPFLGLSPGAQLMSGAYRKLDGTLATSVPAAWLAQGGVPAAHVGWEPLLVAQQLTGSNPSLPPRPGARTGSFATRQGTVLTLVAFAQDVLTPAVDARPLYEQLTGREGFGFRLVTTANAVHSTFIVEPKLVVQQLRLIPASF